jgi:hypothetical protein
MRIIRNFLQIKELSQHTIQLRATVCLVGFYFFGAKFWQFGFPFRLLQLTCYASPFVIIPLFCLRAWVSPGNLPILLIFLLFTHYESAHIVQYRPCQYRRVVQITFDWDYNLI